MLAPVARVDRMTSGLIHSLKNNETISGYFERSFPELFPNP